MASINILSVALKAVPLAMANVRPTLKNWQPGLASILVAAIYVPKISECWESAAVDKQRAVQRLLIKL